MPLALDFQSNSIIHEPFRFVQLSLICGVISSTTNNCAPNEDFSKVSVVDQGDNSVSEEPEMTYDICNMLEKQKQNKEIGLMSV